VYEVHDWAEVHRLFERERLSKSAIAKRLGMSRPTVIRLPGLDEPPRYQRESAGSRLDAYKHAIAAMLDADPEVAATVILEREGHGNSRFAPHAASSYSWMSPPRMSRLRTPPEVPAGAGGSDRASGARRSSPRCGRLAL